MNRSPIIAGLLLVFPLYTNNRQLWVKRESNMNGKVFNFRAFTSLVILWSFILEALSGLVLYIVPPGRIAEWTHWSFGGFTKSEWETIHTVFGYIFLIFVSIHLYHNWHSILHYIKRKIRKYSRTRIELFISLLLVLFVLWGTITSIPPFSSIMEFGAFIKKTWPENKDQPFLARAEKLPFNRFVRELGLDPKKAAHFLEKKGIIIQDQSQSIKDTADENRTSPSQIYKMLKKIIPLEKKITEPKLLPK